MSKCAIPGNDGQTVAHYAASCGDNVLMEALPDARVTIHVEPEHKAKHSGIVVLS